MDNETFSCRRMPLWHWTLQLIGGLFLFFILYGCTQASDMMAGVWRYAVPVAGAALMLGVYALWIRWTEQRPADELSLRRLLPDTGKGLLVGVLFFLIVTGILSLAGAYRIRAVEADWAGLLRMCCTFLAVAVGEEILFRGILFRMIDSRWNTPVALIVSALLFGLMHLPNPGATIWSAFAIAVEAGLLLAAAYKYSDNLWMPIGIHWAWNWMQGPVLGFAVSGNGAGPYLVRPEIQGPDLLTGGAFGAEASVVAVVCGLLLTVLMLAAQNSFRSGAEG